MGGLIRNPLGVEEIEILYKGLIRDFTISKTWKNLEVPYISSYKTQFPRQWLKRI